MNKQLLSKFSKLLVAVLVGIAICIKVEQGGTDTLFTKNDVAIVVGGIALWVAIMFVRRQQKR